MKLGYTLAGYWITQVVSQSQQPQEEGKHRRLTHTLLFKYVLVF